MYISEVMVLPGRRGAGAGAALVLLHYLGMKPLAGPFWRRCGYRPLNTNWEVRPAAHLR